VEKESRCFAQNQWKTRERRELSQKSRQVQHSQEGLLTRYYNNGAKRLERAVSDAEKVGKLKEKFAEGSLDLIKLNGMTTTVLRSIEEHGLQLLTKDIHKTATGGYKNTEEEATKKESIFAHPTTPKATHSNSHTCRSC